MRVINKADFQRFGLKASQVTWLVRKMRSFAVGFLYSKWMKPTLKFFMCYEIVFVINISYNFKLSSCTNMEKVLHFGRRGDCVPNMVLAIVSLK